MRAWQLSEPQPITAHPLALVDLPEPAMGDHDLRIRVRACGVCHTDLDIEVETFPMTEAPAVLARLKRSAIQGAAVLLGFEGA